AERIRKLRHVSPGDEVDEEGERLAYEAAESRMDDELSDATIVTRLADQTLSRLKRHMREAGFIASADELLRQVLVLAWGAFEAFANDAVRLVLNERPTLVHRMLEFKPYREALSGHTLL